MEVRMLAPEVPNTKMKAIKFGLTATAAFALVGGVMAGTAPYVAGQVIVKFKSTGMATRAVAHQAIGGAVARDLSQIGVQTIKLPKTMSVEAAVKYYKGLPGVEYAEPNYIGKALFVPNDARYNSQYAPQRIVMPRAWDLSIGNPNIKIAIVDTGVNYNHEDLKGKVILGKDTVNNDNDPMDDQGHGTHCAGDAAAITNNGIGVAAPGFNCTIIAEKASDSNGSFPNDAFVAAILDAVDRGADIISMSVGFSAEIQSQKDALNSAWAKGVVLVAAAGNDNTTTKSWPGAFDSCIGVGASDANDAKASFSNFGDWVDVAAPGVNILSTTMDGGYGEFSGTSMACPVTAGLLGLMKSYVPTATNAELRAALENNCDGIGTWIVKGRINAFKAITSLFIPLVVDAPAKTLSIYSEASFTQGSNLTGTVANLASADNKVVSVNSVTQPNVARISSIQSTVAISQPTSKIISSSIMLSAKAASGVTLQVFVKDKTGKFTLLKSVPGTTSFQTIEVPLNDITTYMTNQQVTVVVRGYVALNKTPTAHTLTADFVNVHLLVNPK